MSFTGLPFTTLLALFGGMAALTALLYVLRLRRRAVPVAFARLWDRVLRDKESSQLFSQLKRWLSLLLQLALVALLVLALGDPRLGEAALEGRNIVILMDASASMKAVDVAPSRIEAAKAEALRFVRGLGPSDRAVVIQMDARPTPLSTLSGEPAELVAAIGRVRAADTAADLERGLAFALDAVHALPRREIVLVTDGALALPDKLEDASVPIRLLPVGRDKHNLAITQFSARRYPLDKSRVEVMLEVMNTNEQPAQVELTLLGDGVVLDVSRLSLAPGQRLPRFYADLAGANRRLEARIAPAAGQRDALRADDRAYALVPERRRARVLVVTPGNTYLEAALLLDEYLDVTYAAPASYPPAGSFDVSIFDGIAPPPAPNGGALFYLNPPAEGGPVERGPALRDFGFDTWDRKHPLVRFTSSLGDVQVASGFRLVPGKADRVVGASELGPILVAGTHQGRKFVALGFDPRDSDFVLRPAWPLFVLGTIDYFVAEDTSYLSSYRTGESWRIPAPAGADSADLVVPGGARVTVPIESGRAAYFGDAAGFYALSTRGAEPTVHEFAANLSDLEESRIAPRRELTLGGQKLQLAGIGAPGVRRKLWIYLLFGVVAVSVVEWWTYHRRITV